MKCLVLGGGGFIGSYLVEALLKTGYEVVAFDRPTARYLSKIESKGATICTGDFLNPKDIQDALLGCEVAYHLVSATVPQTSNEDPVYDVESNVVGTLKFLDEARKAQVKKIIYASSGGTVYGVPQGVPIKEGHPTDPTSSYGICKLAIEKYLHLYWVLYGIDYCVFRISNAYGPRQPITTTQGVISSFLSRILHGEVIEVWGDGSIIRDYIYIDDIISAMVNGVGYRGEYKIFNIGAGEGHSINDIINGLEQVFRQPLTVKYLPARKFDVPFNVLDISRAKKYLDWTPVVGLQDGIFRMYEWASKNFGN